MAKAHEHDRLKRPKIGAVAVVGGGIGGIQASLDLANAGFKVYLVEESAAIGGHMAQLDKTFPTNDCSMCTLSPKLIEVDKNPNIEIITNAEVQEISGSPGDFSVRILKKPRYVDLEKCNACGDCITECPVDVPSEFDERTISRHAIFRKYPQAIPNAMAISKGDLTPCKQSCPAGVNVQGYLALAAKRKFEEAYRLIIQTNPFPSVCGRVCHHPCEEKCYRAEIDEPVAINNIKRFIADWTRNHIAKSDKKIEQSKVDLNKPKIAVIGGGPSGITCARDLIVNGFPVTVFEAEEKLGGAMRYGIPRFRLPTEYLDWDIRQILNLGIESKTNMALGKDFTLNSLKDQGYQAVFIAIGADLSRRISIKGSDLNGVRLGLNFLREVNTDKNPKLGRRVVVIGGGNVAIDVAMTAMRQGAERVEIISLECRDEMPAYDWQILEAQEEGVIFNLGWGVDEILGKNGKVIGVRLVRCTCVFDAQGKFDPQFDSRCISEIPADRIILAVGQTSNLSWVGDESPIKTGAESIEVDSLTLSTNINGVFAGGDAVYGPKSIVEAIGQGHEAAESIIRFLTGKNLLEGRIKSDRQLTDAPKDRPYYEIDRRQPIRRSADERKKHYAEIEDTFGEDDAVEEARRCLSCGICCECMQCVEVCQPGAIDHNQTPKMLSLRAGAVILSAGFEPFDAKRKGEYGYGNYPNVITSLEFERILSASGPFQGEVLRPSDHKQPKKIGWIQCVGSRDMAIGNDYCSAVCCMYAIKEAVMAIEHTPGLETTIFCNDIRAYGKGFEQYYENSKSIYGVKYQRGLISSVIEKTRTHNLLLRYVNDHGETVDEEFDMVVLSIGMRPSKSGVALCDRIDIKTDRFGFCESDELISGETNQKGIFVAGTFCGPLDVPETVTSASCAAALASEFLCESRGSLVETKLYPFEQNVEDDEPRVGVFICRCGTNIARVVNVPDMVEYAQTIPYVTYAEENLYSCSADTQKKIVQAILDFKLNRIVVASCTPRTHETLFQEALREAGLNKYLFEMANIREQCSWVHSDDLVGANWKAKDLLRMAVARATTLRPLIEHEFEVFPNGIVIGGGLSGMTAALSLANQGFEVDLIEINEELGGTAKRLYTTLTTLSPTEYVEKLIHEVRNNPKIRIHTGSNIDELKGHIGQFQLAISSNGLKKEVNGGAIVIATGGIEYQPTEYFYGKNKNIITQIELEKLVDADQIEIRQAQRIVMIQCVGSREPNWLYCSRVCCRQAVKNALKIKELNPNVDIFVLYRDIRTYGFSELDYHRAREAGVVFIRYEINRKPEVSIENDKPSIKVYDEVIDDILCLPADLLVLSAAVRAHPSADVISNKFKVSRDSYGFFMEAHMKLRPLDCQTDGIFIAGLAHGPKNMQECIRQARGAASRAATILSKERLSIPAIISVVDQERCAACLSCVQLCPYDVPVITEEGKSYIEPAKCKGCGICAAACPRKAISTLNYLDEQITAKLDVIYGVEEAE